MKENIYDSLIKLIKESLKDLKLEESFYRDLYLDYPSDSRFGDLSTNIALQLAKAMKKSPREIAADLLNNIQERLQSLPWGHYIREIKVEGAGFINFYLNEEYFYEQLNYIVRKKEAALKINAGKGRKVLIEFVSANPTGPLSVAHARQAAVGDSLANILEFLGFKVKREYYLNDEGNQINILGQSVELRLKELNGGQIVFPENHYQGDYIYDIARKAQNKKVAAAGLGDYAVGYILNIIKQELDDFGIKFDYWYSQKKLRQSGKINRTLDFLKKKGLLYEQDGALWFKSTQFGDDKDRVVIKSDGSFTYLAPDIAYHQEKYKRSFSWIINLWGPDHHGYINRLKAAVQALGYPAPSLAIIIVQLATIFRQGQVVHMSTRRGQYITLKEVLDEVGCDASRFFFLMRRTSSHLDFDLDIAKKHTSDNPVYYVQYAHARICNILKNSLLKPGKDARLYVLKEKEEIELIKKVLQFPHILNICLVTLDPYMLTVYLQELAESFHRFYDRHRVLGQDNATTRARLALIGAVKTVISQGLGLLGVSRPQEM